jgi:putative ABC transport system permease protein
MRQNLHWAWRALRIRPAFFGTCGAILAITIAFCTTTGAVVFGVLLRPLPYAEAGRLVRLSEFRPGGTGSVREALLRDTTFAEWRASSRSLEGLAGYSDRAYSVSGGDNTERVRATAVSPELFRLLRVSPAAGDFFSAAAAQPGADTVVVLSYAYWRNRFGGSPSAVGQRIILDGRPCLIIGIAPEGFSFPDEGRLLYTPFVPPAVDATTPLERRSTRVVAAIGRLAPGATTGMVEAEGTTVARAVPEPPSVRLLFGDGGPPLVRARALGEHMTMDVRAMIWLVSAGSALLLLIACVTVAGLSLVRNVEREAEFAVKISLGASRRRLLLQVTAEGLIIASLAGAGGIGISWLLVRLLPLSLPADFPRIQDVQLNIPILLIAIAAALVVGWLALVTPAFRATATALSLGGARDQRNVTGNRLTRRFAAVMVLATALSTVLVIATSLLTRSLQMLMSVDTGYQSANVVSAHITLQGSTELSRRWYQMSTAISDRLRAVDGVQAVGTSNMAPFVDTNHIVGFLLPGRESSQEIGRALGYVITPDYLSALRTPLRRGRLFTAADLDLATQPIVVNEEFVRRYLPSEPVVGHQYFNKFATNVTSEVIGVVGNVLKDGPDREPQPELYVLAGHQGALATGRQIILVVRTTDKTEPMAALIRDLVREIDSSAAVHNVSSLDRQRSAALAKPRLATTILAVFAMAAMALTAGGLYGVLSYAVSRRQREFAIRGALGASPANLQAQVLRQGVVLILVGMATGSAAAVAGALATRGMLFNVSPLDPWAFGGSAIIVAGIALAACLLPARRASRVDLYHCLQSF